MLTGNKFVASSHSTAPPPSSVPSDLFSMNSSGSGPVTHVSSSGGKSHNSSNNSSSIWDNIWNEDANYDEQNAQDEEKLSRDAIVFLVDASPFMFEKTSSGETAFAMSLECVMMAVTQKLISSPSDELAVVFYGTRDQQGDFPGVYVFQDFDKPTAQLIERLDELKVSAFPFGHWAEQNPDVEFNLCDAFWTASSLLGRIKSITERRVWLFTDEDSPHREDDDLLSRAKARLEDYRASGVTMRLFAIQRANAPPFSLQPFYRLCPDPDIEENTGFWTAESRIEQLSLLTSQRVMKKRAQASIKMTLAPGLEMSVKLFTLLREADKTKYVYLDPMQAYPCVARTRWVCEDTGQHLRPQQIKKVFPLGDKKIVFENEEIAAIKFGFPPGITVLGFKARSSLSDIHNLTHSSFIFADDKAIIGSGLLFKLLLDKCLERDQFVLVRLVARTNSVARLAALWPAKEEFEGDVMIKPSGFHVILLPFADEIRELTVDQDFEAATPTPEQCLVATKLSECLVSDFEPDAFPNPSLQKHFITLKMYALGKAELEHTFKDVLLPDEEGIAHFKPLFDEFKEVLHFDDVEEKKPAKKRAAAAEDKEVDEFEGDWNDLLSSDANMKKVTIPQLKVKLKQEGKPVSGKKAELWERLKEALLLEGGGDAAPKGKKKIKQEIKQEDEW